MQTVGARFGFGGKLKVNCEGLVSDESEMFRNHLFLLPCDNKEPHMNVTQETGSAGPAQPIQDQGNQCRRCWREREEEEDADEEDGVWSPMKTTDFLSF